MRGLGYICREKYLICSQEVPRVSCHLCESFTAVCMNEVWTLPAAVGLTFFKLRSSNCLCYRLLWGWKRPFGLAHTMLQYGIAGLWTQLSH